MLGIDMSIYARFAVRMSMSMAPQADFTGVRILPPLPAPEHDTAEAEPASDPQGEEIEAARAALADFMADTLGKSLPPELHEDIAGRMELTVRTGDPYAMLFAEARERDADLLVIGTRGRMGLPHTRLGTTAEKLLNEPPCDVLAVNSW
jgi:nucleotide-binding universal stress UspA family protein